MHAHQQMPDATALAVRKVWDDARVALMAREVAGTLALSGASDEQIETATDPMTEALNNLCASVRHLDTVAKNRAPSEEPPRPDIKLLPS